MTVPALTGLWLLHPGGNHTNIQTRHSRRTLNEEDIHGNCARDGVADLGTTAALHPWLMLPVLFVIVAVLAFNFVGDGLRDAADPYSR